MPPQPLQFATFWGYAGAKVRALKDGDLCYPVGTALVLGNVHSGLQQYLWNDRPKEGTNRPVSCVAVNTKQSILVYSELGDQPNIYVLSYPDMREIGDGPISGGTTVEYNDLAFSRNGRFFAALGSTPDFNLSVFSVDKGRGGLKLLVRTSAANHQARSVSFNPCTKEDLVTTGGGHITFWKMERAKGEHTLNSLDGKLANHQVRIASHCHAPNGDVLGGSNLGDIFRFDTSTGFGDAWWENPSGQSGGRDALVALAVTRHHIIAASLEGLLRFFRHESRAIERSITLATTMVRHLSISPEWNSIIVGCGDGLIFNVHLPGYERAQLGADEFRATPERVWPVCDFAGGAVAALCLLGSGSCVGSVSADCTFRVWDFRRNSLLSKVEVGQRPRCCACGTGPTQNLVAVGSETAHVRLLDVSDPQRPSIVLQERLCETGTVSRVRFSPDGAMLVAAVDTVGFFFIEPQQGASRGVVGWLGCQDSPCRDLCWVEDEPGEFISGHANGDIRRVVAPTGPPEDEVTGEYAGDPPVMVTLCKLDFPVERLGLGKRMAEQYQLVVLSRDKESKVYTIDKKPLDVGKVSAKKPAATWKDHQKLGSAMAITNDKTLMFSGGSDGSIVVRDIGGRTGDKPKQSVRKHSMFTTSTHRGGITDVVLSADERWVITAGGDGNIGVWRIGAHEPVPFQIVDQPELSEVPDEEHVYLEKRRIEHDRMLDIQHQGYRESVIEKIRELRASLQDYKKQNADAAPEEKLDVGEFMIQSQRDELLAAGDKLCEDKAEEIKWRNLTHHYIRDSIERECYATMQDHLLVIKPIRENKAQAQEVPNYNTQRCEARELSLLRKVKFLRRVEKLEWQRKPRFDMLEDLTEVVEVPEETDPRKLKQQADQAAAAQEAAAEKAAADAKAKEDAEKAGQVEAALTHDDEARLPLDELLYNNYLVFTRHRILTQMRLLQRKITNIQIDFNVDVKELLETKKQSIQAINDTINKKVRQIQKELGLSDPVPDAAPAASEKPDRILKVDDKEIKAKRHLSPEEQKKFEEEQRKEAARKAESEDGSVTSALTMMMDGRLERDERQVKEIKKPTFGIEGHKDFKATEEWTDDEQRIWADYKKRVQKQAEEELKHKNELQSELKELRKQLAKIETDFDAKLQGLFNKKLLTDADIYQIELQIIKLAQSIVQQEEMEAHAIKLEGIVGEVTRTAEKSGDIVADLSRDLQERQMHFEELSNNEKRKTGDKEIRNLPPFTEADEFCDALVKMLRRTRPKAKGKREKKDKGQENTNPDPFAWVDEEEEDKRKKGIIDPQDLPRVEKPEGLRDELWREFLDFRLERMQAERDLKNMQDELNERRRKHDKINRESRQHHLMMEQQLKMFSAFKTQVLHEGYNLDILHTFKQGQIEVEQEAVVTDYADAILIHKGDIEQLNGQIREHGKGKVSKMKEMMEFKKDIRLIEWENEMLAHQREHYEMDLRHLHTLRVTKSMQEFIKGGQENHHEIERAKIVKKIEHVQKTMQGKIDEKKVNMLKVKRVIREKEGENHVLEEQLKEAQQLVGEREEIQHLQSTGLDHQRNLKLMKDMRVTRKLEDVAKAQQQEMQLLKKEIDRLRERTFPSFAVVSKRVVGNPDQA